MMKKILAILITISIQSTLVFCQTGQQDFPKLSGPYLGQNPPGNKPEVFAPGIVSTELYNHCTISVSPDGTEIYWAAGLLDAPRRIYFSVNENGMWRQPEIVPFTKSEDGDCPVLSPDGKKMFFNSNRPITKGGSRRERIWCVERTSKNWGDPFCLNVEINDEHLHWQVSVDNKENLYFGSERIGSKGKDDIFFAEFLNGGYAKAYSLGSEINTEFLESTPYISPDGGYLIFSREELYISYKKEDGSWTRSRSLGSDFRKAFCPYVSPDGKYLFFLKMGMGYNDIYWVSAKIIEDLRSSGCP